MGRSVRVALVDEVIVELVGDDAVAMVPDYGLVSLTGGPATLLRSIYLGQPVDARHPALVELVELGVVRAPNGVSRRGMLRAGAIGAAAGFSVLALPALASASSIQREPLNGYFFPTSPPIKWRFEIFADSGFDNPFPFPVPSPDPQDISELSLLNGWTFDWINVGLVPAEVSGEEYVTWGDSDVEPLNGVQGDFSWEGSDGVTRYFRVTFVERYSG